MKMRKMGAALLAFVAGCLLAVPYTTAQDKSDKPDTALAKAFKEADAVFTGKIGKVNPLGQTNSIPPSTFGKVSFKDTKALSGALPDAATFSYSFKEGTTKNLDLKTETQVLVAVKQKGVTVIVPATEANLALAKKAIDSAKEK